MGEVQYDGRQLDRRHRVFLEGNLCAQRAHRRVDDAMILVLREPGGAKEQRYRDAVLQADPGVAPGLDIRPVRPLAHQRVAAHDDPVNCLRRRRVAGA